MNIIWTSTGLKWLRIVSELLWFIVGIVKRCAVLSGNCLFNKQFKSVSRNSEFSQIQFGLRPPRTHKQNTVSDSEP